jgi:hypothetical protein
MAMRPYGAGNQPSGQKVVSNERGDEFQKVAASRGQTGVSRLGIRG